jgi:hypothetical protein
MARSLTVKHEESPSSLFVVLMVLCAGLLLLGAAMSASDPGTPEATAVEASAR